MKYKLKEISNIINGSTPSTSHPEYWDGDISWITPKDLSTFSKRIIYRGERNITNAGYNSCSTTLVPKGTVLLTSRAPIGYLAIAGKELSTNQGFKSLVCKPDLINNYYLYYWLQTKIDYLQSISGGATFKELSKESLSNVEIDLPTLDIQQHIVDTIGTVDDLIEKYEQIIDNINKISTSIYQHYKEYNFDNKICLADVCEVVTGKLNANENNEKGLYPFFTCSIDNSRINSYAFDGKSIIIAGNGVITVKYYDGKFNAYQRTYVLQPKKYLYLFLKECEDNINLLTSNSSGSVIKFITKGMLENITIGINNETNLINQNLEKLYNLYTITNQKIENLKNVKEILLKKYFG